MSTDDTAVDSPDKSIAIWRIRQLQALSPQAKVQRSVRKIREFLDGVQGLAYVSWSGGLDSRVMLDIVRNECHLSPERVPAVFIDTGLEYPEVRECALRHAQVVLRPKMTYAEVVRKYGYPVVSKKVSQYVGEVQSAYRHGNRDSATVRLRLTGVSSKGRTTQMGRIPIKWQGLCDAPFRCSDKCCHALKVSTIAAYAKSSGRAPMMGMKFSDGRQREKNFLFIRGGNCNAFGDKPSSWPLAIWTDADIWWYVRSRKLDYPNLYDRGATGTGCYACMFGVHMEKGENRFQRMYRDHPKLWKACMDGFGVRKVMDYIGLPVMPENELDFGSCERAGCSTPDSLPTPAECSPERQSG